MNFIREFLFNLIIESIALFIEHLSLGSLANLWNDSLKIITPFIDSNVLGSDWTGSGVDTLLNSIFEPLKAVGIALAICLWMYGILRVEGTLAEMKRPEAVAKHLLRIAVMIWMVEGAPNIVKGIWDIGIGLFKIVLPPSGVNTDLGILDTNAISSGAMAAITGGDLSGLSAIAYTPGMNLIGLVLLALLLFLFSVGTKIIILVCAFHIFSNIISRFFRMILLYLISPVAASTIASEDTQRVGFQFFKNVVAVSSELALTALLLRIFPVVTTHVLTKGNYVSNAKALITTFMNSILPFDFFDVLTVGTIQDSLYSSITAVLLFALMIFILQSSIRGLNSIIDSLFGLHGV